MKKRVPALLLALVLLAASCANGNTDTPDETAPTSAEVPETAAPPEETEISDNLPEITFDGADISVWGDFCIYEGLYEAELNGEVVNDAVAERNTAVSDRFDVKLTFDYKTGVWRPQTDLTSSVLAGAQAYDLASGVCCYISGSATAGCFRNLNKMEHIDLAKPWYMQFVNDNIPLGDKLVYAAGFFDMPSMVRTHVTFFSADLADQFGIENLYGVVREGGWTYDYMMKTSEAVFSDLDGNGTYDENDRYGITSQWDVIGFEYASTGYSFVTWNDDGSITATVPTEAVYEANELIYKLLYNCDYYYSGYDMGGPHNYENMEKVFVENHALFFVNYVSYAQQDSFREMGSYGILPPPKYREDQERYGAVSSVFVTGIPIDAPDAERSQILLEALEHESWKRVRPAYYDVALSRKYVNDPESVEMLDITFDNLHCDFTYVYSQALGGSDLAISVGLHENYASWFKTQQKVTDKMIGKMIEKINKFDD